MKFTIAVVFLASSFSAYASVDALFPRGMPGAEWGITLPEMQRTHPDGFLFPAKHGGGLYSFIVPGRHKELAIPVRIRAVDYFFDLEGKLRAVFILLDNSDPDSVLHGVAQLLGEDYTTSDDKNGRNYYWKSGATTKAKMQIARLPQPWAYLGLINATDASVDELLSSCE